MKSVLLFAISLLLLSPISFAQVVWPGDVNNNGIVNEIDLLYLGFAFGETGPPRTTQNTDWMGQDTPENWQGNFPDGLNFAYADCDGDGTVDLDDVSVIELNLSRTHDDVPFIRDEILEAEPGTDPRFAFLNEDLNVFPGGSINLDISLGNEDIPVEGLLGLSFSINVNPAFFQNELTSFEFNDVAWISPFENQNTQLILKDPANGKTTIAFSATDKKPVNGAGLIGTVSFVIIEDIIDFLEQEDTVKVEIDSITVVTDDLDKIPVEAASVVLEIEGRTTSNRYNPVLKNIQLYPNPTNRLVLLRTNGIPIDKVEIVNILGQIVYEKPLKKQSFHSLDLQRVPPGLHWIRIRSTLGTRSIAINKI